MIDRRQLLGMAAASLAAGVVPGAAHAAFASRRIGVVARGSGPDVILIHGLDSSRSVWNGVVAAIPGYRWHLVQIAGFGGMPAGPNASGPLIDPVAAEIARYASEQGLRAPAVIGHSMGGIIALTLGLRFPGRIGRLMVVDILPAPAAIVGLDPATGSLFAGLAAAFGASAEGQGMMRSLMRAFGGSEDSDSAVTANALRELAAIDLSPQLPRLRAPMTVVHAEPPRDVADPAIVAARYRAAYARVAGVRQVAVADSGHMVMLDQPARFAQVVRAFLAPSA
jgi:pimeloyl-ACP methyl ester carboxylesterase